jgi:hypothetical protein
MLCDDNHTAHENINLKLACFSYFHSIMPYEIFIWGNLKHQKSSLLKKYMGTAKRNIFCSKRRPRHRWDLQKNRMGGCGLD